MEVQKIIDEMCDVMVDVVAVERRMEALLVILHILQEYFEQLDDEQYGMVSVITEQIESIYQDMIRVVKRADEVLLDK